MHEPRIKMGQVGDRTPPPGLVADLKGFDPDLELHWNVKNQNWVVVQKTRRRHYVGEFEGGALYEIRNVDKPVLWLEDDGEPDNRIFPALCRQRAEDKLQRVERMKRRMKEQEKAKGEKRKKNLEPALERLENEYYAAQSTGQGGKLRSYVPKGFDSAA